MHLKRDRNQRFVDRRGTAYVEYFLAAGAMAAAVLALSAQIQKSDGGAVRREYERQLRELAGPLSEDPLSAGGGSRGGQSTNGNTDTGSPPGGGRPVLN